MGRGSPERLQRDLATLFGAGAVAGLTDRELIHRISRATDDPAAVEACFEVLVERHGPMVLRVCRNVLRDPHDAEDAFQATFLVLAKRMRSIRKLDSLGCWLHGVAARVSARARVDAAKRRRREREGGRPALAVVSAVEESEDDVQALHVQEEVLRLPERYRSVIVLCYWEGLTHEQAAQRLGRPIGTVRSRVARARDMLRRRLIRRGVAPGALEAGSTPAVPLALSRLTVPAAAKVAAGRAFSHVVAAHVAGLSSQVARSLLMNKIQSAAAPALLILLTSIGLGYGALAPQSKPDDDQPKPEPKPPAGVEAPESAEAQQRDKQWLGVVLPGDILIIEVLAPLPGGPISGKYSVREDGKLMLGFYGDVDVAGLKPPKVKEKLAGHLRQFASDQALGLRPGAAAKDNDRIYVGRLDAALDAAAVGEHSCYLMGEFEKPGPAPATGGDTVVDVVNRAGGLTPRAGHEFLHLVRGGSDDVPRAGFPVHLGEIVSGEDTSTNYVLQPGDRLLAWLDPNKRGAEEPKPAPPSSRPPTILGAAPTLRLSEPAKPAADESKLSEIERRLENIETQLGEILKRFGDR